MRVTKNALDPKSGSIHIAGEDANRRSTPFCDEKNVPEHSGTFPATGNVAAQRPRKTLSPEKYLAERPARLFSRGAGVRRNPPTELTPAIWSPGFLAGPRSRELRRADISQCWTPRNLRAPKSAKGICTWELPRRAPDQARSRENKSRPNPPTKFATLTAHTGFLPGLFPGKTSSPISARVFSRAPSPRRFREGSDAVIPSVHGGPPQKTYRIRNFRPWPRRRMGSFPRPILAQIVDFPVNHPLIRPTRELRSEDPCVAAWWSRRSHLLDLASPARLIWRHKRIGR